MLLPGLLAIIPCSFHSILCAAGSKRLNVEPFFALSCEVAIRPSFCWNSHQDTWQTTGVWSQFDSGLKCCQDDVYACTNFMGHQDAAFAGMCAFTLDCNILGCVIVNRPACIADQCARSGISRAQVERMPSCHCHACVCSLLLYAGQQAIAVAVLPACNKYFQHVGHLCSQQFASC